MKQVAHATHKCGMFIITRVASHRARSDTPSITCIVACLYCSDIPTHPSDQWQGSTRATRERPQDLHKRFNFTLIKLAITEKI